MQGHHREFTVPVPGARTALPADRMTLPGDALAAVTVRTRLRTLFAGWVRQQVPGAAALDGPLADDAVLLASELVTNAVVHAGTAVEVACRLDPGPADDDPFALVVEVFDSHSSREVRTGPQAGDGHGLRLVAALAESWGVTYRGHHKIVWFRLPLTVGTDPLPGPLAAAATPPGPSGAPGAPGAPPKVAPTPAPAPLPGRTGSPAACRDAVSFLAETSDLLTGRTDEDTVVSLAAELAVPRLADWCALWLEGGAGKPPQLVGVRHSCEERIAGLRTVLEKDPPALPPRPGGAPVAWPWPGDAAAYGPGGAALACRLTAGDRVLGTLLIGRAGLLHIPDEALWLIEDFARRVALALVAARRYARQAAISRVLQSGLLPSGVARIPGVDTAVVYEPAGEEAWAGGDFYDIFDAGDGRWCFALGDVCGSGPEAAVVTGSVRPVLRALAREGHGVAAVLDRLNREVGDQSRFLSLLHGELLPDGRGTMRCTLASAGHPLPLLLARDGGVRVAAEPQLLLGVVADATYRSESFELRPGDTLLCVTDGVTEHRSGERQFDDDDGLAAVLRDCAGLSAAAVAERVRRAVHAFGPTPPSDDLAMLVVGIPPWLSLPSGG